jgi:hypothetical protein
MRFSSELEIREQIARYLAGQISLQDFEDWFVARSWNFHEAATPLMQEIVSQVELLLAEHSNSHLDEQSLRQKLLPLVTDYVVEYRPDSSAPHISTSSVSESPQSPTRFVGIAA